MRKHVEIQVPDLFKLQPTLKETILEQIKKDKRTSSSIMAKKIKCAESAARRNLELLVSEGVVRDLGFFKHNSNRIRIFEIV